MQKIIQRPRLLALLLPVIYLLGLAFGAVPLNSIPIARQKRILTAHVRTIAREHLLDANNRIDRIRGAYTHVLIYNADGSCALYASSDSQKTAGDFDGYLQPFLPNVTAGNEIFKVTRSYFSKKLTHFWLVVGTPLMEQGNVVGAVFIIDSLMNLQEAFIGYIIYFTLFYWLSAYFLVLTARKRKKLDEVKENYIANVTHALKTPIASVKVLTEALSDSDVGKNDPEKRQVYYGMILQEVNLQSGMVQDMLELSKLQSKGVDFTKSFVDVRTVFERVEERYSAMCDYADIALNIRERVWRLPPLYTNAACLQQILELLIDNAMKFVDEGDEIEIDAAQAGNHVTFRIWDNGAIIPKEDLPYIFERFYKGSNERNETSSGLGLAIAKEIMNGLKEKIWVESEDGKGTAFYFTVRLK